MQELWVSKPPHATNCWPFSTTERVWAHLPWEENKRMRRVRGYLVQEKEGWCRLVQMNRRKLQCLFQLHLLLLWSVLWWETVWNRINKDNCITINRTVLKAIVFPHHQLGNCLLGRWWLGQGGGALRWEKPPRGPSSGSSANKSGIFWDILKMMIRSYRDWVLVWKPKCVHVNVFSGAVADVSRELI